MLKQLIVRLVIALILVGSIFPIFKPGAAAGNGAAIIADHTIVDQYAIIPQYWINQVKEMYLNVPGESHSAGYRIGLELLELLNSKFKVINTGDNQPAASDNQSLRVNRWVYHNGRAPDTGEQEWYTWHAWDPLDQNYPADNANLIEKHLDYCDNTTPGLEIDAIGFGWCWDMTWQNEPDGGSDNIDGVQFRWAGSSEGGPDGDLRWGLNDADNALTGNSVNMDDYIQATEDYISYVQLKGYKTEVFFTTGPVDDDMTSSSLCPPDSEAGYQREIKQQYIRDYVKNNSKILFDYADILTYGDNDPIQYTNTWDGAPDDPYPQIHPDNKMDYDANWNKIAATDDGDHIGEVGALRLGKAMWWLLARLAGWDGTPETEYVSVTIKDVGPAGLDFGDHNPGAIKQPEADSASITMTAAQENTRNAEVYLKGTDFTGAAGTFSVANAFYNDTNDPDNALAMSNSYGNTPWKPLAPGESLDIYHWLTIPVGTPAGTYSSNFTYKTQ